MVVIDCFSEGERAAEFLLEQGHRHLFYVGNRHEEESGPQREADADLMLAGFERALRRLGHPLPTEHVFFCRPRTEEVRQVAHQAFRLRPRPTAGLVFGTQTMAMVLACLPEFGLACPENLSLVCKAYIGDPIKAATLRGDAAL